MKRFISILLICITLTGCYDCDTFYCYNDKCNWENYSKDSVVSFKCWSPSDDFVETLIRFEHNDSLVIKNLEVEFSSENGKMQLTKMKAQNSLVNENGNDSSDTIVSFEKFSLNARKAYVKGFSTSYILCFSYPDGSIEGDCSISIKSELQYGSKILPFYKVYDLKPVKSCSFKVH